MFASKKCLLTQTLYTRYKQIIFGNSQMLLAFDRSDLGCPVGSLEYC